MDQNMYVTADEQGVGLQCERVEIRYDLELL